MVMLVYQPGKLCFLCKRHVFFQRPTSDQATHKGGARDGDQAHLPGFSVSVAPRTGHA